MYPSRSKHRARPAGDAARSVVTRVAVLLVAATAVIIATVLGAPQQVLEAAARIGDVGDSAGTAKAEAPAGPAQPAAQAVVAGTQLRHTKAYDRALAAKAEKLAQQKKVKALAEKRASEGFSVPIATFNVLGSNHTIPSGDHPKFPGAAWRTPQAAALIRNHGTAVIGTQELKPDQLNGLQRLTGFAAYPGYAFGSRDTDNSILYDDDRYEFVDGSSFAITFMSGPRPQTVLKLRDRETGREFYVVNMHTSAGHDPHNTATRYAGMATAVTQLNSLMQEGLPVFVTGDMNDRAPFFCRVVVPTGMVAAVGGSTAGGCHPPARMPVDWIVGSPGVSFTGYVIDESSTARHVSDHFYVSATAVVPPL